LINKLIGGMITLVVGLSLLPVIHDVTDTLTGTGGAFESTTVGALIDLLPLIFVIVLVAMTVILVPRKS